MYKFLVTRRAKLDTWIYYFMFFNKHDVDMLFQLYIYQLFTSQTQENHCKV